MKMLACIAAALLLPAAALAQAPAAPQPAPGAQPRPAAPQPQAAPDTGGEDTIEVANPFTSEPDHLQLVEQVGDDSQLTFGKIHRPEPAESPLPDWAPVSRSAVGLAFSMKLGR